MTFKDIFNQFVAGVPVKRKAWRGYWKMYMGEVIIYTKTGEVIPFKEVKDWAFTLSALTMDDWEVATDENCDIEVK